MAKRVQGLPEYTSDPATLAQLGWVSVESFVERKCILWIWNLLNLDNDNPVRSVTTSRMNHFKHETESVIPRCMISPLRKICNIIHSYGLTGDLVALLNNPLIMPYGTWKYKVSQDIMCHEKESWRVWCVLYPSLIYYVQSVEDISICSWWKLAINIPKLREACRVVMTLITSFNITNRGRQCELCDSFEPDTLDHMVARCNCFGKSAGV